MVVSKRKDEVLWKRIVAKTKASSKGGAGGPMVRAQGAARHTRVPV